MYRLYYRDGVNRRITQLRNIDAPDDQAAIAACEPFREPDRHLELWAGGRLVSTLSARETNHD